MRHRVRCYCDAPFRRTKAQTEDSRPLHEQKLKSLKSVAV